MGVTAFVVRLAFPAGWDILGLQLGYFPLYIALFILGVRARANGWLPQIDAQRARRWFYHAAVIAILFLPVILIAGERLGLGVERVRRVE